VLIKLEKEIYQYTPNQLGDELNDYLFYEGNLLNFSNLNVKNIGDLYFKHDFILSKYKNNIKTVSTLFHRACT
jgi:hypothetical protein